MPRPVSDDTVGESGSTESPQRWVPATTPAPPRADRAVLLVGLTGGIGSGKSTVSALLAEHGAVIVDADEIARFTADPGVAGAGAHGGTVRATSSVMTARSIAPRLRRSCSVTRRRRVPPSPTSTRSMSFTCFCGTILIVRISTTSRKNAMPKRTMLLNGIMRASPPARCRRLRRHALWCRSGSLPGCAPPNLHRRR